MATDLREKQGTTIRPEAVRSRRLEPGAHWPLVAAGTVLVVLAAVAALVFTQGRSQLVFGPDHWAASVEGMMTDVREGSGYALAAGTGSIAYPQGLENAGAYARGALTENREGSGYGSVQETDPRGPLGSTRYADGALTEIREGA